MILVPIWLPLLLSWAAFYEVELARQSLADTQAVGDVSAASRRSPRAARMSGSTRGIIWGCAFSRPDAARFPGHAVARRPGWEQSRGAWLVYLVPLAALMIAFPHILSRIWNTSTLPDGPLRDG